ncbi:MAG: sensor histidine kinase, partial [Lachnospiraceae bacterium]|nr:sensor histidine kinase [Lachnospiraceae bacterium]
SEEEVRKLKEAISIYDSSVHTGSDIFDTVICQKKIYCEKHGISFTALADGKAFGFMTASHLYALLLNALDNAIEAVDRLSSPDQKVVLLSARRERDRVVLEVANYYSGVFDPDQPDTVKADRSRHGYGLKSMRYIVKQYQGTLTLETEDDMFTLTAVIPVPEAPPA